MIVERLDQTDATSTQYPVHTNRASEIGHPCERYLVFDRTRWQEKRLPTLSLQRRFMLGGVMERYVIDRMRAAGLNVVEQQRQYYLPAPYNITGHIDGKLILADEVIPFDIKSTTTPMLSSLRSWQDMMAADSYLVKYVPQLSLYLHMDRTAGGSPKRGMFLFIDRISGQYKEIELPYNEEIVSSLLAKAVRINEHVAHGTCPDPMPYNPTWCDSCGYAHICNQHVVHEGTIEIIDDPELEEMINQWAELADAAKEYNQLNNALNRRLEARTGIVGPWMITGRWSIKHVARVPEDVRQQYTQEERVWLKKIVRLTP